MYSLLKGSRETTTLFVLFAGVCLFLLHLYTTPTLVFTHDIDKHFNYIRFIAEHHFIPESRGDELYYHPPLYYILAALALTAGEIIGLTEPMRAVCFLSLIFYVIYLYYAAKLLIENTCSAPAYYTALAVVVFWPLGVNMARLINNDVPLFMAQTAAFYYLMRWWKDSNPKELVKALLWNAIAINFKSSGLIFSAVILIVASWKWLINKKSLTPLFKRNILVWAVAALLLAGLPLGRSYYYHRIENNAPARIFFMAGVIHPLSDDTIEERHPFPNQVLNNKYYHYLFFDLRTYITQAFYDVDSDRGGRQYFWNSILKTSLFDEFIWNDATGAIVLSVLELLMVQYIVATLFITAFSKSFDSGWIPLLLALTIQFTALLIFRFKFNVSFHQEYRFVFAITPLFCLQYAKSIEWWALRHYKKMAILGVIMGAFFAVRSIEFILRQDLV